MVAILNTIVASDPIASSIVGWIFDGLSSKGGASLEGWHVLAFLSSGLVYCYVASAPITIIHATRMFRDEWVIRFPRYVWALTWLLLVLIVMGSLLARGYAAEYAPRLFGFVILAVAVPAGWTMIAQMVLVFLLQLDDYRKPSTLLGRLYLWLAQQIARPSSLGAKDDGSARKSRFVDFYRDISVRRTSVKGRDYRESYTHMREHANSIFIALMEISLACLLVVVMQLLSATWELQSIAVIACLFLWMLPNVFLWSQANRLERALLDER